MPKVTNLQGQYASFAELEAACDAFTDEVNNREQSLRTLEWIGRKENVVVCGPSGTGKTFYLEALGQNAVESGMRLAWFRLLDLDA